MFLWLLAFNVLALGLCRIAIILRIRQTVVRPKKFLGQHFLRDKQIAYTITQSLTGHGGYSSILEIGPGMGILTDFLQEGPYHLLVNEIDDESVEYLIKEKGFPKDKIVVGDFLALELDKLVDGPLGIIGNFPYNISSQIFFKVLDYRDRIPEVVGMVQKEVGERLASGPGTKDYGILSVLLQAYYTIEYLFTVEPEVFDPPPKVRSGVIRLKRNEVSKLPCDEKLFKRLVKTGFQQRRKTLRNALKSLNLPASVQRLPLLDLRAERLKVSDYVHLCQLIEKEEVL
jgi:16S rRNA (adenine1518-N6/adenine1519-N6)-dimethyltransferase